jgi:hypothetical protein
MTTHSKSFQPHLDKLDALLDEYLVKRAPEIPTKWKETIVAVSPWATFIILIIALPALFALLGVGTVITPYALMHEGAGWTIILIISLLLLTVSLVLEAMAIPGLFKRSAKAWNLLYYATLVSFISGVFNGNIIGNLVGTLIGLYILFQVREYYK